MKLIVGLGNPGKKYAKTRHNLGFMVLDKISELSQIDVDKEIFNGLLGRGQIFDEDVMLFKPQTYMNLSGQAVSQLVNYFKINLNDLIVICDDMALNPGTIRLRIKGSSGGQKGLQNIIDQLGTNEFKRVRVGIGEPDKDAVDYVLESPQGDETILIEQAIDQAVEAIKETLKSSFEVAMTKFN